MTRDEVVREMMIALVNYRSEHYAEDTFLAGMQAALARAEECGWKLLPSEPNAKMIDAGSSVFDDPGKARLCVQHVYKAMRDAGGKP